MSDLERIYDNLSTTYESVYVDNTSSSYVKDEVIVTEHWRNGKFSGKIISLGIGSGQDISILEYPKPDNFTGYDFSAGMLSNARVKYPEYNLIKHDCDEMISNVKANVLVAMFGIGNYLGVNKLLEHYNHLSCDGAFFILYNEWYDDNISDCYERKTKPELFKMLSKYNPYINDLYPGANYYVVWWNDSTAI